MNDPDGLIRNLKLSEIIKNQPEYLKPYIIDEYNKYGNSKNVNNLIRDANMKRYNEKL
jgi:hypothetical protein